MSASLSTSLAKRLISRAPLLSGLASPSSLGNQSIQTESDLSHFDVSNDVKLDILEKVLDEVSGQSVSDQTIATALLAEDAVKVTQPTSGSRSKEKVDGGVAPIIETGGITYVEHEPQPEIPVEVESFLKRVDDSADKISQEIVLADSNLSTQNQKHPTQPVIVVPITPEIEKQAKRKSPKFSIVWLVEWSRKIIKKFLGQVIYRD